MKATFEFNLPDDQNDYDIMNQSTQMLRCLWDIGEALRSWEKYGHQFTDANDAVRKIREDFHNTINNYGINIDL
jgi:REP element-mobilizing transposase RayT